MNAETREQTIRSIKELADLMVEFSDDNGELVNLMARMQIRLGHLRGHLSSGRPDIAARIRNEVIL